MSLPRAKEEAHRGDNLPGAVWWREGGRNREKTGREKEERREAWCEKSEVMQTKIVGDAGAGASGSGKAPEP